MSATTCARGHAHASKADAVQCVATEQIESLRREVANARAKLSIAVAALETVIAVHGSASAMEALHSIDGRYASLFEKAPEEKKT